MSDAQKDIMLELLEPTNNNGSSQVFNDEFVYWDRHIDENIRHRNGRSRYNREPDAELLRVAKEHAASYQRPTTAPIRVTLTHPLYVRLSHASALRDNEVRRDAEDYMRNLAILLHAAQDSDKVDIVLLETLHHYAAATSRLLERGLVSKVIFTEYDWGRVLDISELEPDNNFVYYCGGAYNNFCLKSSLTDIDEVAEKPITAVMDIIINQPCGEHKSLWPLSVEWPLKMPSYKSKTITLKELLEKF